MGNTSFIIIQIPTPALSGSGNKGMISACSSTDGLGTPNKNNGYQKGEISQTPCVGIIRIRFNGFNLSLFGTPVILQ